MCKYLNVLIPNVSPVLQFKKDEVLLYDLGSTHGTSVNKKQVKSTYRASCLTIYVKLYSCIFDIGIFVFDKITSFL